MNLRAAAFDGALVAAMTAVIVVALAFAGYF